MAAVPSRYRYLIGECLNRGHERTLHYKEMRKAHQRGLGLLHLLVPDLLKLPAEVGHPVLMRQLPHVLKLQRLPAEASSVQAHLQLMLGQACMLKNPHSGLALWQQMWRVADLHGGCLLTDMEWKVQLTCSPASSGRQSRRT